MIIDQVTVTMGEEKFSPVQYHTMNIGPFSVTVKLSPDETLDEAYSRAWAALKTIRDKAFKEQLASFLRSVRESAEAARARLCSQPS